jgi:CheY-like chemotaxis protein
MSLILLVDDFEDARDIYSTYLRFRGFEVVCADNGIEALARARERRPDLILMDLRMPGLSGSQTLKELRADPQFNAVPVIALTAQALDEERRKAFAAGFDDVISKPCLPDQLARTVADVLSKRPV